MTNQKTTKNQRTPTAEIRGLILDASKRIIEEDGYEAFTIRLLSEKAGVSPASIYRHIGDKQAVINTLIDESFLQLREKLLRVTTTDPLQRYMTREWSTVSTLKHRLESMPCCGVGMPVLVPSLPGLYDRASTLRPGGGKDP